MDSEKILIIGLDGANREVLVKGMNQGKLTNFREIAETGSISTLKSPLPPITPVSMASILTGNSPGKHGVFSFEEDPESGGGYVDYNSIDSPTIFDYLDQEGKDLITVNVPMTSPLPDKVDIGVSGFPIKDAKFAKPYPIREQLRERNYSVEPSPPEDNKEEFIEEIFDLAEKRFEISKELIQNNWDVFFLMLTGDARLQHFIEDDKKVMNFYREVDRYLGNLLDEIEENVNVIILSDHGFSKVETVFDIGAWLEEEGYMSNEGSSDTSKLYGKLDINLENATAYSGGAYMGNIYADENIKKEIQQKLSDLEFKGEKVFRDVFFSEEIYSENDGPDIIPVPRRGVNYMTEYSGEIFNQKPEEDKVPDREGVLITSFDIKSESSPESKDILPTILDRLNIGAKGLEGRSLLSQ